MYKYWVLNMVTTWEFLDYHSNSLSGKVRNQQKIKTKIYTIEDLMPHYKFMD
jgi:hypothetical protein